MLYTKFIDDKEYNHYPVTIIRKNLFSTFLSSNLINKVEYYLYLYSYLYSIDVRII